jgi:hypothetical protein
MKKKKTSNHNVMWSDSCSRTVPQVAFFCQLAALSEARNAKSWQKGFGNGLQQFRAAAGLYLH